jgi:ATP phosphoribosyltransferase regulatory subunit
MKYNDLITPVGTKDYLFVESKIKNDIRFRLHEVFKMMGYSEIMTPGIEFYDVFDQNSHYFPQEKMLKFTDSKNRLLVLRPDSTIPIARVVATRLKEAVLPLRLFYNQPVYRHVPEFKGKSVEVEQMGIEMIGSSSHLSDFEVIDTAIEALKSCCDSYNIELGHAAIYNELISLLDASSEKKEEIRSLIESKNFPMLELCLDEIGESKVAEILKRLPELFGGREVFDKARTLIKNNARINAILNEMEELYDQLLNIIPEENLNVDLAMAHKTDYYTGIMIKGYLEGYGEEVLSGGRYDKLLSEFDYDIPAIGFAINIDAITKVKMKNSGNKEIIPDIVVHAHKGCEIKALNEAKKYRAEGFITEFSLFNDDELVIEYAKERKISRVVIVKEEDTSIGKE